jgi:hypothetical protein
MDLKDNTFISDIISLFIRFLVTTPEQRQNMITLKVLSL